MDISGVKRREAALFVGSAAGSAGAGVATSVNHVAGLGLGSLTIVTFLPWVVLFAVFAGSAVANRWGVDVGGITVRIAQLVLVPLAIRTYTVTRPQDRPKWGTPEWLLLAFIAVQFLTSYFDAQIRRASLEDAMIVAAGALTYYAVYASVSVRRRLLLAVRVFLILAAIGAAIGTVLLLAYFITGWTGGIQSRQVRVFGGAPPVRGLAYEHDLFGSTCAAAAIAFFALFRQGDTLVFGRKTLKVGFWLCMAGTAVSQARAAYVGLAFCMFLLLILPRAHAVTRRRVPRVVVVLILAAVALGGLAWAASDQQQIDAPGQEALTAIGTAVGYQLTQSLNVSTGTGGHRVAKYQTAFQELLDAPMPQPLIGRGTNSWGQRHFHPAHKGQVAPAYLESLYMRSLYDSGFLGLFLIGGFILYLVWPSASVLRARGDLVPLALALTLASMLLAISYAATDSTLLIWPWILFGLTRAVRRLAARQHLDAAPAPAPEALPAEA